MTQTSGAAYAAATYTAPNPRVRIDLNRSWRFVRADVQGAEATGFDDSGWSSVNTPHTWNAVDGADGGNNYYRGVGWYRRHYTVPSELAGKRLYLQFAGVNQVADVWVNGRYLGQHKGGYSRFRFGATGVLVPGGDNVIAVKVTNARDTGIAPVSADYTFEGGIYRNVSLWAVDDLHVRMEDHAGPGVYLRQSEVTATSATVTVTTKLWNDGSTTRSVMVRSVIADKSGNVVAEAGSSAQSVAAGTGAEIRQTVRVDRPRLWNGLADPYLHNASVPLRWKPVSGCTPSGWRTTSMTRRTTNSPTNAG
ncbi:sugar-binding domain-containing protein [Streptomyces muensis]|uniref:Beta galactosidase jelly roll domain-containing protein n=1 Tax=Streptomyces muensis TaxID=1077944 RepID=A0A9X1PVQ1_STRM4|nr:sugar-binding domain-containing protein [Streptomyces muensis]MCF1592071.1 beta galactosidase jelly roll domain-containing protein [Streptomyces muensis]